MFACHSSVHSCDFLNVVNVFTAPTAKINHQRTSKVGTNPERERHGTVLPLFLVNLAIQNEEDLMAHLKV